MKSVQSGESVIQTLCLVAYGLGAGAVWAVTGQYALLRGLILLVVSLAASAAIARGAGADWAARTAPVWVVVGWFGGALAWNWALVAIVVMVALGAWWARSVPGLVVALVALGVAIIAGVVPVWGLLAVTALPLAWKQMIGPVPQTGPISGRWAIAFDVQLLIGFLIKGMVR